MPNQRSKDKKQFGLSLDRKLVDDIAVFCDDEGIDRTEFMRRAAVLILRNKKARATKKSK